MYVEDFTSFNTWKFCYGIEIVHVLSFWQCSNSKRVTVTLTVTLTDIVFLPFNIDFFWSKKDVLYFFYRSIWKKKSDPKHYRDIMVYWVIIFYLRTIAVSNDHYLSVNTRLSQYRMCFKYIQCHLIRVLIHVVLYGSR